ncbi:MAG: DMT family transporter [Gammaproteobacteria bacterium]|nr:DMT family transporter [Gammaproteobacteria bacterium]
MTENLRAGAALAVAAAAAFALTAACVKGASAGVGNEMVVFFRSAVSLLLLLPWLLRGGAAAWRTARLGGHLWRAGFGVLAMYCFFYAIAHLNLAAAMLLTYSTPLYVPFIAWMWIGERPPAVVFPAVALGLLGLALIVKPGVQDFVRPAALVGVASGLFAACAMVSIRRISDTEPATRIVFYFSLLSTAISAVPLAWTWQAPTGTILLLLIACGIFATVGQLCLTRAYALAAAARIGPFTYTSVIFAGLIGWLLWDERPDAASLAGMALVVGSCVLAGWKRPEPALEE